MKTDSEWAKVADDYLNVTYKISALRELEKVQSELKDRLIELAGPDGAAGCGVSVEKITRLGPVDHAKILKSYDIDGEQYRKADVVYYKVTTHTEG